VTEAASRTSLPIDPLLPEIAAAVRARGVAVVVAPPGAGKTTRVPPALLDALDAPGTAAPEAGRGRIVMLEPRRVAARAAARRIAEERGGALGDEVGFRIRFERAESARTRILVVTEGILVAMLREDPFLEGIAALVFDEFHERNLDSDLALAMAVRLRGEARPDLAIVAMSATIDAAPLARYLSRGLSPQPPLVRGEAASDSPQRARLCLGGEGESSVHGVAVIESPGRLHPVAAHHRPPPKGTRLERAVADAVERVLDETAGDVLVFLPGTGEIRDAERALEGLAARRGLDLCPLHGDLPAEAQDRALRAGPRRRVILATNVAESSVTVEGVTAVVDSGLARVPRLDLSVGLDRLEKGPISRASADQRAGRAGRVAPGVCVRLWSALEERAMPAAETPEVRRVDLAGAALQLLAWGETDLAAFPWFEAPAAESVARAIDLLELLGAAHGGRITALGERLARLPLPPRLGRLALEAARVGHPRRLALVAALLAERDPLRRLEPGESAEPTESDVLERVHALELMRGRDRGPLPTGSAGYRGSRGLAPQTPLARGEAAVDSPRRGDPRWTPSDRDRPPGTAGFQPASIPPPRGGDAGWKPAVPGGARSPAMRVHPAGAQRILRARDQIARLVERAVSGPPELAVDADEAALRALLAAFPDRLARRRGAERRGVMVGGRGVRLRPESGLFAGGGGGGELFLCVDIDAGRRGELAEAEVRQGSIVERDWLDPAALREARSVEWDADRRQVVEVRRVLFADLAIEEGSTPAPRDERTAALLAARAAEDLARALALDDPALAALRARIGWLSGVRPELALPAADDAALAVLLPDLCAGKRSFAELRAAPVAEILLGRLAHEQRAALEREAPERIEVPSGSRIPIEYAPGKPPVLAARIQELFGWQETPRLAGGRAPLVLHLLAPNHRPEQVTSDLASFWRNTYPQVRKDLRRRYPKHAWPEDPLTATAERRPKRRG